MINRDKVENDILVFLRNHGKRSFRAKEIARKLNLSDNESYQAFQTVLQSLKLEGRVSQEKGGKVSHLQRESQFEGVLSVHRDGYGFVSVEGEEQDFFVRPNRMRTAIDGDRVLINRAVSRPDDNRVSAEIIEVLERVRKSAVGTLHQTGSLSMVVPDDLRLSHDIYVSGDDTSSARDGDKVVVSIDSFEDRRGAMAGRILRVLGRATDPAVRTLAVAMSAGVRAEFPEGILDELQNGPSASGLDAVSDMSGLAGREDFRSKKVFTIDPVDAKDFDDAIHLEPLANGEFEIGVHIADVSHFVREGSAIDSEAYARGTSVYLVDRVIPMLPEELSNDLCSLKPNTDRLAFSCVMRVNGDGFVVSHRICESIIHSMCRFTYEDAQQLLDGADASHPLSETLAAANDLAKKMAAYRRAHGSINFDQPEIRVLLDEDGNASGIVHRERLDAHRLIEEFMLLANRTVARAMCENTETAFVSRIHEPPDREKIKQLAAYVRPFGHQLIHSEGVVTAKDLNALLASIQGRPEEPVIEQVTIRSMSKARYSLDASGHFGLSEKYYTHFTSPIRRFPDLVVHRLIKRKMNGIAAPDETVLRAQCDHFSETERIATEAERASVRLKQVEYAENHLGDAFSGVITGVSRFGVFILITELLVEGMVHVRDMDDDYYEYDERTYSLVGQKSKQKVRLGDEVRVIIAAARTESREIDLVFENIRPQKKRRGKPRRN